MYRRENLFWLLGSILFLFITVIGGPRFWHQMEMIRPGSDAWGSNYYIGIMGVIVYFTEPIIWHTRKMNDSSQGERRDSPANSFIVLKILSIAYFFITTLIYVISNLFILLFRPILRALILYTSLSYTGNVEEGTGLFSVFSIAVCMDILLYYIDLVAPKWKYNPLLVLSDYLNARKRGSLLFAGNIMLVIHTAFIYTFLSHVVYSDTKLRMGSASLPSLALWWIILTVYSRVSFVSASGKGNSHSEKLNWNTLILNLFSLAISFFAFIWPFLQ